jgi:hypothetical protein
MVEIINLLTNRLNSFLLEMVYRFLLELIVFFCGRIFSLKEEFFLLGFLFYNTLSSWKIRLFLNGKQQTLSSLWKYFPPWIIIAKTIYLLG